MHWVLPDGRCISWSVRKLASAREDELVDVSAETCIVAYELVAKELGYFSLGKAADADVAAHRAEPGAIKDKAWKRFQWNIPENEVSPCWWIANFAKGDQSAEAKLICRSLTCCRLEIQRSASATAWHLSKAWQRRVDDNSNAVGRLRCHTDLWQRALGPDPEKLLKPNEDDLHAAQQAASSLHKVLETHDLGFGFDNPEALVQDCVEAAKSLRLVTWEAIRREMFSVVPQGRFHKLARTADSLLNPPDEATYRRRLSDARCERYLRVVHQHLSLGPERASLYPDVFSSVAALAEGIGHCQELASGFRNLFRCTIARTHA